MSTARTAAKSASEKRVTTARVTAALTMTMGAKIDAMHALREQKRELEARVKTIEEQSKALEEELMEELKAQGVTASKGSKASCSISETISGNIVDDTKFFAFIKKTGYFHLLQRRVSDAAYRELLEQGKAVPGLEPFTKKRLNLRAI